MQIVALIPTNLKALEKKKKCNISCVTCSLFLFTCYENPSRFCDATGGGLVIDQVKKGVKTFFVDLFGQFREKFFLTKSLQPNPLKSYTKGTDNKSDLYAESS